MIYSFPGNITTRRHFKLFIHFSGTAENSEGPAQVVEGPDGRQRGELCQDRVHRDGQQRGWQGRRGGVHLGLSHQEEGLHLADAQDSRHLCGRRRNGQNNKVEDFFEKKKISSLWTTFWSERIQAFGPPLDYGPKLYY